MPYGKTAIAFLPITSLAVGAKVVFYGNGPAGRKEIYGEIVDVSYEDNLVQVIWHEQSHSKKSGLVGLRYFSATHFVEEEYQEL